MKFIRQPVRLLVALWLSAVLAGCERADEADYLAGARARMEQRDAAGAVAQLKGALERNPDSVDARLMLGKALLATGNAADAVIELRKAMQLGAPDDQVLPELARAMLARREAAALVSEFGGRSLASAAANADFTTAIATAQAALGKSQEAQKSIAAALASQPDFGPAVVLRARLDAENGKADDSLAALSSFLTRKPDHEPAALLLGDLTLRYKRDPEGALAVFRKVVAAHPRSVPARSAAANVLLLQDKPAEARAEVKALSEFAADHADTQFLVAQLSFVDRDYKACVEILDRLLAKAPDNVRMLALAGSAELAQRHYTLAVGHLARALKVSPELVATRQLLAQAFIRSGSPEKAVEVLQPVVDSAKADAASLLLAGQAQLLVGDGKRSAALFQRAQAAVKGQPALATSLALLQLARGDTAGGYQRLEAIAGSTATGQAEQTLASAKLQQGDLKGALQAVDRWIQKAPDGAAPQMLRGRILERLGDPAGAAAAFEKALAKDAQHYGAVAGLARLDAAAGAVDRARNRLEEAARADPRDVRPRLGLAELDDRLGLPDRAVMARLRDAITADPGESLPRLLLIDRLLAVGDAPAALVVAQDATAALPQDLGVMESLGRAQLASGDSQRAVSTFKRLASLQPGTARFHLRLADAHMAAGEHAPAGEALRKALEVEPGHLGAQRGLALLAAGQRRRDEAIAIVKSVQQRKPQSPDGYVLEGEVEAASGNWSAAAGAYRLALQRGRTTDLATKLHRSLAEGGKAAEADRWAADWLGDHARDTVFLYYLGSRASATRDWAQAEARYRQVLALQPRHAAALNNLAWALASQKKPGAVATAQQANEILPERASLLDTLAFAQESENQLARAVETQRREVEIDPRDAMLRLRLAKLLIRHGDRTGAAEQVDWLSRLGRNFAAHADVTALAQSLR